MRKILINFFIFYFIFPIQVSSAAEIPREVREKASTQNRKFVCPKDLETLIQPLLRDLPSYANRVIQRSRLRGLNYESSYVLLAGRPEFEPLPLGPGRSEPAISSPSGEKPAGRSEDDPRQVFITTLERNYSSGQAVQLQHYHWLFLTKTESGWRLAMMFSRLGTYPAGNPPLPPRDNSNGAIAQAISTWLRDCRAGTVRQ
ncbi:MAG: hypothetical protein KME26_09195 [Oscillatoria princeps RMCB-10]|jgi:hypothetical protein|nr:hypothetical protein [Oscillatoria princeps RMCB-10]